MNSCLRIGTHNRYDVAVRLSWLSLIVVVDLIAGKYIPVDKGERNTVDEAKKTVSLFWRRAKTEPYSLGHF